MNSLWRLYDGAGIKSKPIPGVMVVGGVGDDDGSCCCGFVIVGRRAFELTEEEVSVQPE